MGFKAAESTWIAALDGRGGRVPFKERLLADVQPPAFPDLELYVVSRTGSYMWHKANAIGIGKGRVIFWDMSEDCATLTLPAGNCVLLVDIDIFADIDDALDWLQASRWSNPHVPVVIFSEKFTYNDLSTQRAAIADASVRTPSSMEFIGNAISQAIVNKAHYRPGSSA